MTEVVVDQLEKLGSDRQNGSTAQNEEPAAAPYVGGGSPDDADLPF